MRRAKFSCIAAALTLLLIIFCQGDREETARMVPILIGFEGEKCLNVITDHGGIIRFDYSIVNAAAAYVPEKAIGDISNDPGVKYVEMDEILSFATAPQGKPSKPPKPPKPPAGQEIPWGVDRIDADMAWATSRGAGVNVAVLDGGVDYTHPDLLDNYAGGVDLWDMDGDPMDDSGHGTMVAGVIAAVDNEEGVIGVAPDANLYAVRVGGYDKYRGKATDWGTLIEGLDWCVENGMHVINDSVWGSTYNETYELALQAVWAADIVYIAAAGNQGAKGYYFFSGYSGTHVGAIDSSNSITTWSSHGHFVDLCAPGASILTTDVGGGYGTGSGTSFAAPHVAGVAALILEDDLLLSNDEVLKRLYVTAERLNPSWWDEYQGWGLVDAEKAVDSPGEPESELQYIEIVSPSATGEVGFYTRFAAIGTYANESQYNLTFDATWTNSNTSVADLFWDALAKGLEIGSTTLTASYDGKNRSLTFDVGIPSRDIIIIEEALWTYNKRPNRGTLSVTATSTWGGSETLTVEKYGTMIYDSVSGKYTFSRSNVTCPFTVWVSSGIGGCSYAFTTVSTPAASAAKVSVASRGGRDGQTMLMQNMPNPFNPDTWIPFRLSAPEHVVIKIHSLTGRLVRTLDLGNKPAGAYTTKEKAAYWDGKNEAGEYVSSGIYFYTIEAGDFIATKKMLIAR